MSDPSHALEETVTRDVTRALEEDVGTGDLTVRLVPEDRIGHARLMTRESGVLCGAEWFNRTFEELDPDVEIFWHHKDGDDITEVPMYKRARRGIGYLSQEPSVFRKLTVEENILAILETLKITPEERKRRLEELLDELGIKRLRGNKAYSLSGGERRRLEITRALVTQPKFMMLDEPFAGVDPIAVHDIQSIVAGLRHRGIGVLISDHNVEQTLDIVDRAYIMFDGQVKVSGTVQELVFDDEVARIYLGPTLTARLRSRFALRHDNGEVA